MLSSQNKQRAIRVGVSLYSGTLLLLGMEKNVTLEDLLMKALQKLKKEEFYEEYLQVLLGAWYTTVPELKLALSDGDAWSDIQLPGRLKLEMKRMIIGMDQKEMGEEGMTPSSSSSWAPATAFCCSSSSGLTVQKPRPSALLKPSKPSQGTVFVGP